MTQYYFVSFASSDLWRSLKRIGRQVKATGLYDHILACNETDLDPNFLNNHADKLVKGTRGFGYWMWKPQIILQTLQKMNDGDVLTYCDAGCHIREQGKKRLEDYLALARTCSSGIVAFSADPHVTSPLFTYDGRKLPDLIEGHWCKGDLLDYFGVRNDEAITHTPTIGAGIIFLRKTPEVLVFIERWLKVFTDDFSLVNDDPSRSPNLPNFNEHRHDQPIFAIMCKQQGVSLVSAYEYWYPCKEQDPKKRVMQPDWETLKLSPIHARRDKDVGWLKKRLRKWGFK